MILTILCTMVFHKHFLLQPVGVVGVITPWNFPLAMITRKVGPLHEQLYSIVNSVVIYFYENIAFPINICYRENLIFYYPCVSGWTCSCKWLYGGHKTLWAYPLDSFGSSWALTSSWNSSSNYQWESLPLFNFEIFCFQRLFSSESYLFTYILLTVVVLVYLIV